MGHPARAHRIAALLGNLIATIGFRDLAENLLSFALVVIAGTLLHAAVTLPLVALFVAMATAIGAPGIPSAGMVTMVAVLEAVGLPVEAVGILLAIDRFLDTTRTMANVEGDAVVAICVAYMPAAEARSPDTSPA